MDPKCYAPLLALTLVLTACGQEAEIEIPSWAKVAPEQIAEAAKHGVPVAFENDLGMRFVLIPAGTFLMGSPEDEEGRRKDEAQKKVTLSRPFYMQITEVTNHLSGVCDQLKQFDDYGLPVETDPLRPVVNVNILTACSFGDWLSRRDPARSYRLPSEAEWEYACRATTTTRFSWGNDESVGWRFANALDCATVAEYEWKHDCWPADDGHDGAAAVASYPPNPWGLYDMHGNVSEWCYEKYDDYVAEPGEGSIGSREPWRDVVRGGGHLSEPNRVRSASRDSRVRRSPLNHGSATGFRLVSPLPEPGE